MGLLVDPVKAERMNLLTSESFSSVFGPKKTRKKPKLSVTDVSSLAATVAASTVKYSAEEDKDIVREADLRDLASDRVFEKGTSRRIWGELYKVLDCSDVVVQVLDARDPLGTRSQRVERHLKDSAKHKHLIFVLNKCDLVPTWVTKRCVCGNTRVCCVLLFYRVCVCAQVGHDPVRGVPYARVPRVHH